MIDKEKLELQSAEFDAVMELTLAYRNLPPVVDDNYPEMRHYYESSIRAVIAAFAANGRLLTDVYPWQSIPHITAVNLARALRWHPEGLTSWSLSDWGIALSGEVGELANVVKKLNRVRDGLQQKAVDPTVLKQALADEIGDVYAYLDLFTTRAGLKLEDCIRDKFNRVSEREGFPERL